MESLPSQKKAETDWALLALLRFSLAGIVAGAHLHTYFTDSSHVMGWMWNCGAKAAVLGFFLVSGYSIAASLRRYPTGFYTRRLLRIYPIYLLTIVCAFVLERAIGGDLVMPGNEVFHPSGLWIAIANLFFLQTFIVKPIGFDIPVWSLAIEVAYYLAAPFLARLPKWGVLALIGVSAVSFASPRTDAGGAVYYLFTHFNMLTYAWAWMMGFYFYSSRHWAIVIGFAALGSVVIRLNTYLNPEPYAVATYLGALALVVIAAEGWAALPRGRLRAAMNVLGDISYPFYLLQYPIILGAYVFLGLRNAWAMLGLCLLGSALAHFGVDTYVRRLVVQAFAASGAKAVRPARGVAFLPALLRGTWRQR